MKLTMSNIAWETTEDEAVAALLRSFGVEGIEVAPAKIGPDPLRLADAEVNSYRGFWEGHGLKISSMQALLFGRPDLVIFGDEETRERTKSYLAGVISLAGKLGAGPLVFGSPRNRTVGSLPREEAWQIAVDFFRELGKIAEQHGTILCVEPNPSAYGCDFVTTTAEGIELVEAVQQPGFRLHLDVGGMCLNGEDYGESIRLALPYTAHLHVSEPHLQPVGSGAVDHAAVARAIRNSGYDRWVSIEMRATGGGANIEAIRKTLELVTTIYR